MPNSPPQTLGGELAHQLINVLQDINQVPLPGARGLPLLTSITPSAGFFGPQDNSLLEAANMLVESQRVYTLDSSIVMETVGPDGKLGFIKLAESGEVTSGAECQLANLLTCKNGDREFPVPRWFTDLLLRSEILRDQLPRIQRYCRRPVLSTDLHVLQPGWHERHGIMIHGEEVENVQYAPVEGTAAVGRLPPYLRRLLSEFCFRTDADVANYLGVLLTAILADHFVNSGKALAIFDGNQPGVGKTMLARIAGIVADGKDPGLLQYTADESEFYKRLGSCVDGRAQSVVIIDNAKGKSHQPIESAALESNCVAPKVSFRRLGHSQNIERYNDLVWMVTANHTRMSTDLQNRAIPIQLEYEGQVENRTFRGPDPIDYAMNHRNEILAELFGIVMFWVGQGCPRGTFQHRLQTWATTIGGILETAGFPEFLSNAAAAASTMNSEVDALVALAEMSIRNRTANSGNNPVVARVPKQWVATFIQAKVLPDELTPEKTDRAKAMSVAGFLKRHVGRELTVELNEEQRIVTLRSRESGQRQVCYWFEIVGEPTSRTTPQEIQPSVPVARITEVTGNSEQW